MDTTAACLTHHQILAWVAPFVRAGWVLDLPSSDRLQRRLVFKPVLHAAAPPAPGVLDTLQLDSPRPGFFTLLRTLRLHDGAHAGLQATVTAEGQEPAALLAQVQRCAPLAPFRFGADWAVACSQSVDGDAVLASAGEARAAGMALALKLPTTGLAGAADALRRVSAAVELHACPGAQRSPPGAQAAAASPAATPLPDDLLAVLGWDWSPLEPNPVQTGWRASVRLHGDGPGRARDLLHKLEAAARHLACTLAQPPQRFHERLSGARLRVLARRGLPFVAALLFGMEVAFAPDLRDARASLGTALLLAVPPALVLWFLWRSERPRIEWPSWPRPLAGQRWSLQP